MFSPILPTRPLRTPSTVGPKPSWLSAKAASRVKSAGSLLATSSASDFTSARNESFLVTKSVSQLTSTMAPVVPSITVATTPSAAIRDDAFEALLPSLTRSSSSARSMSPPASARAFLHSIIGASVLARSAPTMLAVIAAISFSPQRSKSPKRRPSGIDPVGKKGLNQPLYPPPLRASRGRRSGRGFVDLDELVARRRRRPDVARRVRLAFEHRVGHRLGVQRDGLRRVVVAGNHVVDADRRMVRIDDADNRNAELFRLGDGDLVKAHVDHEHRVGQGIHVLDAADVLLELDELALKQQRFLLDPDLGAGLDLRLHFLHP